MQTKNTFLGFRRSALALAVASVVTVVPVVQAQDDELEEITVTGSRIRATDGMAEPTPVTSMTPLELMTFEPGGTIAEQLDALPQFFATGTAQRGGATLFGDGGGSYLDMRGLGRNRTLVLLDGSRVVPADKRGTVNVDNIPMALVRSVDVITGGASAAYGADALGGVTNFVLNREYEGLKFTASTGMNEFDQDGKNYNFSVAAGQAIGDSLHVIGSLEVRHIDEIRRDPNDLDSDWFKRWGHISNTDPNGPARVTKPWVTPTGATPSGVIGARGSALNGLQFTDDGTGTRKVGLGDYTNAGYTSGGSEAQNYSNATASPITGSGVENRTGFLAVKYDATDALSVYAQGLVGRTESSSHTLTATAPMMVPWFETIYRSNPYIPESVAAIMDAEGLQSFTLSKVGSYPGDLEQSAGEFNRTTFTTESFTTGFDYDFGNSFALSGSYQKGESRKKGGKYPGGRVDREALARDAVIDPATGAVVCNVQLYNPTVEQLAASPGIQGLTSSRDGVTPLASPIGLDNTIRDCVPYNAMGAGNMNQAAWDYIHTPKTADSWVKQDFAELLLQGDLHDGWGYGPVSFATGVTYRKSSFKDQTAQYDVDELGPPINDPALGIRGIAGAFGGGSPNLHTFSTIANIGGSYNVKEWFGELQAPIWESSDGDQVVTGNAAVRRSDYSSSGAQDSWKLGVEFQIYEDLRLRATKSRDVREASFAERFDTSTGGLNVDDPFTNTKNVNVSYFRGGNPKLRPEIADSNVVGFVFEPSFVEGLRLSTDWYSIDISDSIDSISEQNIVDQCFLTNAFCENLSRDGNGTLVSVSAPYLNLSNAKVRGVDVEASYLMEPDFVASEFESLSIRFLYGHLIERTDTPYQGAPLNQIGSTTRPEDTANLTLNYTVGPWSAQWQQRYVSDTLININWVEGIDVDNNTIPTYSYTNLLFTYRSELENGGNWSLSMAVSNAFDKNPAIIPGTFNRVGSQTNVGNGFDEFGRRYQLTLKMDF